MSARQIGTEVLVAEHPVLRVRTLFVLPAIPDGAPREIREGIARRRITTLTGQCPCGAVLDVGSPVAGEQATVAVEHERGCPAITTRLAKAIRRWVR